MTELVAERPVFSDEEVARRQRPRNPRGLAANAVDARPRCGLLPAEFIDRVDDVLAFEALTQAEYLMIVVL